MSPAAESEPLSARLTALERAVTQLTSVVSSRCLPEPSLTESQFAWLDECAMDAAALCRESPSPATPSFAGPSPPPAASIAPVFRCATFEIVSVAPAPRRTAEFAAQSDTENAESPCAKTTTRHARDAACQPDAVSPLPGRAVTDVAVDATALRDNTETPAAMEPVVREAQTNTETTENDATCSACSCLWDARDAFRQPDAHQSLSSDRTTAIAKPAPHRAVNKCVDARPSTTERCVDAEPRSKDKEVMVDLISVAKTLSRDLRVPCDQPQDGRSDPDKAQRQAFAEQRKALLERFEVCISFLYQATHKEYIKFCSDITASLNGLTANVQHSVDRRNAFYAALIEELGKTHRFPRRHAATYIQLVEDICRARCNQEGWTSIHVDEYLQVLAVARRSHVDAMLHRVAAQLSTTLDDNLDALHAAFAPIHRLRRGEPEEEGDEEEEEEPEEEDFEAEMDDESGDDEMRRAPRHAAGWAS